MVFKSSLFLQVLEFTHFACTSEDINNISHALMLKNALEHSLLPAMDDVIKGLKAMAHEHAGMHTLLYMHVLHANATKYKLCYGV